MTSSKAETNMRGFMQFIAGSVVVMTPPQIPLNAAGTTGPPTPDADKGHPEISGSLRPAGLTNYNESA